MFSKTITKRDLNPEMLCFFGIVIPEKHKKHFIERHEAGKPFAFEFKWSTKAKPKFPKTFTDRCPDADPKLIKPANYDEFLLP